MIVCDACKLSFPDNSVFIRHLNITHSHLKTFVCSELKCQKSFSLIDSFIRHIRSKHKFEIEESASLHENLSPLSPGTSFDICNFESDEESTSDNIFYLEEESSDSNDSDSFSDSDLFWDEKDYKSDPSLTENIDQNIKIANDEVLIFTGKLYHFPDLSRKHVNRVISEASQLFESSLNSVQNEICSHLKTLGASEQYLHEIRNIFHNYSQPFRNVQTEKQIFSQFRYYDTFIVPESYRIGERTEFKSKITGASRENIPVVAQFIPIRFVLQKFFEMPGVFDKTMGYVNYLKSCKEIISNIIQGPFWREKSTPFEEKMVLPLLMYFNDYENNNPLGSHKGISKCGAVYLSVPCLPPEFQSKIENIFLFILFNSLDRTTFQNSIIFEKAIQELKFLYDEGITLNLPTGSQKIHFHLALIIGDNLGLHSIFGFMESFRANKFCRFCLIDYQNINKVFTEKDCILRDVSNYDFFKTKDASLSGIKEICVFNKLPSFHVTNNPAVDVMHDYLEGICRYDVAILLKYFIYVRKYFELDHLNTKLRAFHYGANKNVNKPPQILESHLKKKCIILSSAEMLNLVMNLNLIIGLSIDEDDDHWQLLLMLQEIIEIVCSTKITAQTPDLLELRITEYLTLLNNKFPNSLKPKHHFIVHYPSIMRKVGPLWNICCMRHESKNREGKVISRSAICRVNICRTIALRHQLIQNYRFMSQNALYPTYISSRVRSASIQDLPNISCFIKLLSDNLVHQKINYCSSIKYMGKTIKEDSVIIKFSELGPAFHFVYLIILKNEYDFVFVTRVMTDCFFNEHMRAFKIYDMQCFHWEIFSKADMQNAVVSYANKLSDGMFYITKNWI